MHFCQLEKCIISAIYWTKPCWNLCGLTVYKRVFFPREVRLKGMEQGSDHLIFPFVIMLFGMLCQSLFPAPLRRNCGYNWIVVRVFYAFAVFMELWVQRYTYFEILAYKMTSDIHSNIPSYFLACVHLPCLLNNKTDKTFTYDKTYLLGFCLCACLLQNLQLNKMREN